MTTIAEITNAGAAVCQAINKGDVDAATALYMSDGALLPPGAPIQSGRAAIADFWRAAIDAGLGDLSLTPHDVVETADGAVEVGSLTASMGDAALVGKYINVWRREGTAWKIFRDIWNTDA